MDIEEVIHNFSVARDLPVESLRWALDNWQVAAPRFAIYLDDLTNGHISGKSAADAMFYIAHLYGEKRETAAFPAICEFLKHRDLVEEALGDAITESLRNVLIAAYDGEPRSLQSVIECEDADEFVRSAALEALSYLSFTGAAPQLDMHAYMLELLERMQPRETNQVWTTWALEAADLGYADFADKVEGLCRDGFIEEFFLNPKDFATELKRTLDDPTRRAGFEHDRFQPFTDTIGELSKWYGFSEQRTIDEAKRRERAERESFLEKIQGPVVNPMRHVGRNDPCPCGSAKKYQKCCLAA